MKKYNYVILVLLLILFIGFFFLKNEFDNIHVDLMSDGQAGIGKGIIGILIFGIGVVSFVISIVTGVLLIFKRNSRSQFSFLNLFTSLLLPIVVLSYLFF